VAKPEDWKWSSFSHYQTSVRGTVEIESEGTARDRGWQLPEWMRYRHLGPSSRVPKSEGGRGHSQFDKTPLLELWLPARFMSIEQTANRQRSIQGD
jgi:hypothetical protein